LCFRDKSARDARERAAELFVGDPEFPNGQRFGLVSGIAMGDVAPKLHVRGPLAGCAFGAAIAAAPSPIQLGETWLAIGAPGQNSRGVEHADGAVYLVDLCTNEIVSALSVFDGLQGEHKEYRIGSSFGSCLSGSIDIDGDGDNDLLVGAPDGSADPMRAGLGFVEALSLTKKKTLCVISGQSTEHLFGGFGRSISAPVPRGTRGSTEFVIGAAELDVPGGSAEAFHVELQGTTSAMWTWAVELVQ
jgi:hypothetical protein